MERSRGWSRSRAWWLQFPAPLRELATLRLAAALGGGGVIYLTPMVFHQLAFSAVDVTEGFAVAALAGTAARLLCGLLLDRGANCSRPALLAAGLGVLGDLALLGARGFGGYLVGQVLIGTALGFWWPAIELAVPLSCAPVPSARAFALVRSADALGIAGGALLGALLAAAGLLRGIYVVDIGWLLLVAALLTIRPLPDPRPRDRLAHPSAWRLWLPPLLPMLAIAVLATAMPALMQSALPLDLVRGALARDALPESLGALLIGLQLALVLALQWPVGRSLALRPVTLGLRISFLCFASGCLLLALSALVRWGGALLLLAQVPLALGQAAFLPTATEAVLELTPLEHRGLAMALFSQCFAISAFAAPLLAGRLLDGQGHGVGLWLLMGLASLLGLSLVRSLGARPAGPPPAAAA